MGFWDKVKDELDFRGISQKDFAAKLDINVQTFRNSMSLNRLPDLLTAYKISQEFNRPLEYFINDNYLPSNYDLPTRELVLLENYRKLSCKEKKTIDSATRILARND